MHTATDFQNIKQNEATLNKFCNNFFKTEDITNSTLKISGKPSAQNLQENGSEHGSDYC